MPRNARERLQLVPGVPGGVHRGDPAAPREVCGAAVPEHIDRGHGEPLEGALGLLQGALLSERL